MKIHVICGKLESVISGMPDDMTVADICCILEQDLLIPFEKQCLVYQGKLLTHNLTLRDCNIQDGGMLFVVSPHDLDNLDELTEQESLIRDIKDEFAEVYGVTPDIVDDQTVFEVLDRMLDLGLNHCELSRNGQIEMMRMYSELEKRPDNTRPQPPTVIPERPDGPSVAPLPALFFDD